MMKEYSYMINKKIKYKENKFNYKIHKFHFLSM